MSGYLRILFENETLFHIPETASESAPASGPEIVEIPKMKPAGATPAAPVSETPVITAPLSPTPPVAEETLPGFVPRHKILILIEEKSQEKLIESEAIFLNNILKAVGHSLEEADVLNIHFLARNNIREVLNGKQIHYFITFGVPLIKLQLDLLLAPYVPKTIKGIRFLLVDPLVVIEADRNLKKKLWQALQNIFEIS